MTSNAPPPKRRDLKGTARRKQILAMLAEHPTGDLSVEEIADAFGTSFATVRRDLSRLRRESGVARTYGGIALTRPAEVPTRQRGTTHGRQKSAIAKAAAAYVQPGDLVIVDAGTTTTCLARELLTVGDLTVVTNGVGVMSVLLEAEDIDVVVLGGHLRGINETITGSEAEEMLRRVRAATAFIGTDAVSAQWGLASRTSAQSRLKSLMMERADQVVVLADSSKLIDGDFQHWSPVDRSWRLITDDGATAEQLEAVRGAGAARIEVAHATDLTTAEAVRPMADPARADVAPDTYEQEIS